VRGTGCGELVQAPLELFTPPADHHELGGVLELEEDVDQGLDRADSEPAGGDEDRGSIRGEPVLDSHGAGILRDGEHGIDGDARHGDSIRWDAEALQMSTGLVERDEVPVDVMGEPHSLDVKIGHDDRLPSGQPALGSEPGDNLSW
jgi:hypothetical protein